MKEGKLGEFEEVVIIIVAILADNAYAFKITEEYKTQSQRQVSIGSVHSTLERLVQKGFLISEMGDPSAERGGRRKRIYSITAEGQRAIKHSRDFRISLWNQVPDYALDNLNFA